MDQTIDLVDRERMRWQLKTLIDDWNSNRLDLFSLNEPNEDLEFHGVMRFYFHEIGEKVATKCIRVSSTATTRAVIDALVEKFHPDMKMLTSPKYSLWEVHENGAERRLAMDEKPLLVQLNWHKDDREGRFLLKNESRPIENKENDSQMNRKLSKREKKEQKKLQQKVNRTISSARSKEFEDVRRAIALANAGGAAGDQCLYNQLPNNNFTRTISNPEIVMKKRRERKLEQRLKEMGEGGSLKIYGQDLSENRPYVTLLVSTHDRADKILKETLEKYGLDWHDPSQYCFIERRYSKPNDPPSERVLLDHERPLLLAGDDVTKGLITYHVRRRTRPPSRLSYQSAADDNNNSGRSSRNEILRHRQGRTVANGTLLKNQRSSRVEPAVLSDVPCLLEIGVDGEKRNAFYVTKNVTIVGCDPELIRAGLYVSGPKIQPRHCTLTYANGLCCLELNGPNCPVYLNERLIFDNTVLRPNDRIRFGQSSALFVFTFASPNDYDGGAELLTRDEAVDDIFGTAQRQRSPRRIGQSPTPKSAPEPRRIGEPNRDCLPAIIEVNESAENDFISTLIRQIRCQDAPTFKLGPAYVIYMHCRFKLSNALYSGVNDDQNTPDVRHLRLSDFLTKISDVLHVTIQDYCHDAANLAYWMSNCAEILNFLKCDRLLNSITDPEPQESLAEAVRKSFDHLSVCFKQDLHMAMPAVLKFRPQNPTDSSADDEQSVAEVLQCFENCMRLLRACRVNAALTIQLFSQLFYYVNMYLFNWLISREGSPYCCRRWGRCLSARLARIRQWAQKQGLELAADCRLERISQAAVLLKSSKFSSNDLQNLSNACPKLNSLQVRSLLERYRPDASQNETAISKEFVENMLTVCECGANEALRREGSEIRLEEDLDLSLPFLLPDDGYSPESFLGLTPALKDFVDILLTRGLCRMIMQPTSSGRWDIYFDDKSSREIVRGEPLEPDRASNAAVPREPEIFILPQTTARRINETNEDKNCGPRIAQIIFEKGNGGIGLSIVQAQGNEENEPGIFVKKVVPNSAAARDGRLRAGDQLLEVNGRSLVGVSQDQAAQLMAASGPTVTFLVAQGAVYYNGLARWMELSDEKLDASQETPSFFASSRTPSVHSANPDVFPATAATSAPPLHPRSQSSLADSRKVNKDAFGLKSPTVFGSDAQYRVGPSPARHPEHLYQNFPPHERQTNEASHLQYQRVDDQRIRQLPSSGYRGDDHVGNLPKMPRPVHYSPPAHRRNGQNEPVSESKSQNRHQLSFGDSRDSGPANVDESLAPSRQIGIAPDVPNESKSRRSIPDYKAASDRQTYGFAPMSRSVTRSDTNEQPIKYNADITAACSSTPDLQSNQIFPAGDTAYASTVRPAVSPPPPPHFSKSYASEEELEKEIGDEVELLMKEEMSRLKNKSTLTPSERKRYHALCYELENRRGARITENNNLSEEREPVFAKTEPEKLTHSSVQMRSPSPNDYYSSSIEPTIRNFNEGCKFVQDFDQNLRLDVADDFGPSPTGADSFESPRATTDPICFPSPQSQTKYIYDENSEETTNGCRARVIGAQEVYRDPRQERLRNLQKSSHSFIPEVEKLSFKDKMKLFAKEVGDATPKTRFKTSSAQREIETGMQ